MGPVLRSQVRKKRATSRRDAYDQMDGGGDRFKEQGTNTSQDDGDLGTCNQKDKFPREDEEETDSVQEEETPPQIRAPSPDLRRNLEETRETLLREATSDRFQMKVSKRVAVAVIIAGALGIKMAVSSVDYLLDDEHFRRYAWSMVQYFLEQVKSKIRASPGALVEEEPSLPNSPLGMLVSFLTAWF